MKKGRSLLKAIDTLSDWSGKISSYLLLVMVVVILYEVACRYFFQRPTIWVHELTTIMLGFYLLIPAAYALYQKTHTTMDILYSRLSLRTKAMLDVTTSTCFFFWCTILMWGGAKFAAKSIVRWEHSVSVWSPPIWEVKLAIPVATLLLALQGIAKLIRDLHIVIKGRELNG